MWVNVELEKPSAIEKVLEVGREHDLCQNFCLLLSC